MYSEMIIIQVVPSIIDPLRTNKSNKCAIQ